MENSTSHIAAILRRAVLECIDSGKTMDDGSGLTPYDLFMRPEARAIKNEIIRAGKKLWQRQYVDGNGGNLSARISEDYVICTPTLRSKGDLTEEDCSLVDLENRQICGDRNRTSEILLHLEIYKAQPAARAVIHCHPPYATAHAVAGKVPPGNLIPEQEVFVGPVALSPYETPGTLAFARTVLPFIQDHNTVLLANHGIVCWADTIEHAEWYVEVTENYCKTVMIASQLKSPLPEIPADKIADLLAVKEKLGLPDPRLAPKSHSQPQQTGKAEHTTNGYKSPVSPPPQEDVNRLVDSLTSQVLALLKTKV